MLFTGRDRQRPAAIDPRYLPRLSPSKRTWTVSFFNFVAALALVAGQLSSQARPQDTTPTPTGTTGVTASAKSTELLESTLKAQAELIQKLSSRLEQLERREAERTESLQQANTAEVAKLQNLVDQLQEKVSSLESGRVLPEITVSAEDTPTVQELDQKIRVAERKHELAMEAAEAKAQEAPRFQVGPSGFSFSSADTNFVLRLKGVLQLDSRTFFNENPLLEGNDGILVRRARPIFEGTVYRDFDFAFVPDFAPPTTTLFDAYLNYRYEPSLQLRVGKFKPPIGLEQLQSDTALSFNERALPSDLVPTRDVGLQLWGELGGGKWNYALGVFNGTGDGRVSANAPFDDDKEFAGRVFLEPWKGAGRKWLDGIGLGIGGSYGLVSSNVAGLPNNIGGTLPGYWTAGQQQFFAYNPLAGTVVADGTHWRMQPQANYFVGPFGLSGEYGISHQDVLNSTTLRRASLNHQAWNVAAQWVLTGENATYGMIHPKRPFNPKTGGWGAWQLVGRYGQFEIDDEAFRGFSNPNTSARSVESWSVGLNWWLNRNVRLNTSFSYSMFEGGGVVSPVDPNSWLPPATVTSNDELVFFTRLQLAF
ncbi:MAG TPA: porin [Verrucomicrobiales bacterium]|nr:porin [Verrucomicrobiales bacterium]